MIPKEIIKNGEKYLKFMPVGEVYTMKYDRLEFTEQFVNDIYDNFKQKKFPLNPFVDIDHDGGKSYGDLIDMIKYNDESGKLQALYGKFDFNLKGKEYVSSGTFKHFSPTIRAYIDEDTGEKIYPVLETVSLTNRPVLKKRLGTKVSLSEHDPKDETIYYLTCSEVVKNNKPQQVKEAKMDKYKKELIAILNLSESATDEEIQSALNAKNGVKKSDGISLSEIQQVIKDTVQGLIKPVEKVDLSDSTTEDVVEDKKDESEEQKEYSFTDEMMAITIEKDREVKRLREQLDSVKLGEKKGKVEKLIEYGKKTGRITPESEKHFIALAEKDIDAATEFVESISMDPRFADKSDNFNLSEYTTKIEREALNEMGVSMEKAQELKNKYKY